MSFNSLLMLAAFFFIMGAAVMGIIWYLQSVASGKVQKDKQAEIKDPNLSEVARLMRDKTTQDLVVGMNSHTFHLASELNPGQSRRLHFVSDVLVKWLAQAPLPPPLEQAQVKPPEEPVLAEPIKSVEEWIPAEIASLESKHEHTPPFMTDPPFEVKPVSTQISDVVGGILTPAVPPSTPPEFKSIAMQIDEILQDMIADTHFEERGISVNDDPDHGVMVTLDGKEYPGVKDVPDEEVRNLIRSAVVEWEKTGKFSSR